MWRRLLMPYFGSTRMKVLEGASRAFTTALLDPLLSAGGVDAAHDFGPSGTYIR
jgi:cytochrome P450